MPDPIKKQIMDRVLSNLAPLKTNGTFRDITREWDVLRPSKALPALMVADGKETTLSKTATVWTCRFDLQLRMVFAFARDKDALVSEVQKKIEADMTLNTLGAIVDAGNEEPAVTSESATVHRTTLRYTVQYARKIGDPTAVS
ncbi:MAG TPA: hypothetical protein VK850_04085 [Candidatus Binatia bacterium]|nr:hypothetical protein [Candidatus Binatia bacterium]